MSDKTTPAAPAADKKKRQVAPAQFALLEEQTTDGKTVYVQLPLPDGIDTSNPKHRSRSVIEAAVKRNLEEGKRIAEYSGKRLRVVDFGNPFVFKVVEEVKTTVTSG